VIFLNPQGEVIEHLRSRDAAAMREQIEQIVQNHSRPVVAESSIKDGLEAAREQGQLLAVVFWDDPDNQTSQELLEVITSEEMEPVRDHFHWIWRPMYGERRRVTEEARRYRVSRSPTLLILCPEAQGDDRVLERITSFRDLNRTLQRLLDRLEEPERDR
jgi:hypothetical protein